MAGKGAQGADGRAAQRPGDEPSPGRGTRIYWLIAAAVLSLVCAGLMGINLARWVDSRDGVAVADDSSMPLSDLVRT